MSDCAHGVMPMHSTMSPSTAQCYGGYSVGWNQRPFLGTDDEAVPLEEIQHPRCGPLHRWSSDWDVVENRVQVNLRSLWWHDRMGIWRYASARGTEVKKSLWTGRTLYRPGSPSETLFSSSTCSAF